MATDYNNRLITPNLEKAMKNYPLYSQDGKKKDALCFAVFSIGNARWYILEGQRENDDFNVHMDICKHVYIFPYLVLHFYCQHWGAGS